MAQLLNCRTQWSIQCRWVRRDLFTKVLNDSELSQWNYTIAASECTSALASHRTAKDGWTGGAEYDQRLMTKNDYNNRRKIAPEATDSLFYGTPELSAVPLAERRQFASSTSGKNFKEIDYLLLGVHECFDPLTRRCKVMALLSTFKMRSNPSCISTTMPFFISFGEIFVLPSECCSLALPPPWTVEVPPLDFPSSSARFRPLLLRMSSLIMFSCLLWFSFGEKFTCFTQEIIRFCSDLRSIKGKEMMRKR